MPSSISYLPRPPRAWSRVQNQCTYVVGGPYNATFVPLINKTVTPLDAIYMDKQLYKGNILQYKANSSRITKNQRYAQISKGCWSGRTKVFATQSQTYSNPNTTGLLRINSVSYPFPNQIVGAPNNISGPFQYNVQNPYDCSSNSLQDGGNLLCSSYANPCTNQITQTVSQQQCFPTYCSDVPGPVIDLCWNSKLQTWFPKARYVMNNSTNKWPENYKGFQSAIKPAPPVLSSSSVNNVVTLSWTDGMNPCLPISNYILYQNGKIFVTVPYTVTSFAVQSGGTSNSYYVVAVSTTTESYQSNTVTVSA